MMLLKTKQTNSKIKQNILAGILTGINKSERKKHEENTKEHLDHIQSQC